MECGSHNNWRIIVKFRVREILITLRENGFPKVISFDITVCESNFLLLKISIFSKVKEKSINLNARNLQLKSMYESKFKPKYLKKFFQSQNQKMLLICQILRFTSATVTHFSYLRHMSLSESFNFL